MPPRDPKVKGAEGKRIHIDHTIYDLGTDQTFIPPAGTQLSGGGVVTDVSGTRFTVEFPGGSVPKYIELPGVDTTVIVVVTVASAESTGPGIGMMVGGGGPFIGQAVDGGGTVTGFTETTVTIAFPNGVPDGPINLPWVETTVVQENPPAAAEDVPVGTVPLDVGEIVASFLRGSVFDPGTVTPDGTHKVFRVPCPGSQENAVTIQDTFLLAPTNAGNCGCSIYLASVDSGGNVIGKSTKIRPGKTLPTFELAPGGAAIVVACDGACTAPGCFGVLQVSFGIG